MELKGGWRGPKRDREGIRRMVREAEGEQGVSERDIPGTRKRHARVEKRVRAAHYARDTSRSSTRGGRVSKDEARQETHRSHEETGRERGRSSRGEGVKACARDEGAQGGGGRREEPLEKPGRMLCRPSPTPSQ